eukprot:2928041-Rhodomonas_salina.1
MDLESLALVAALGARREEGAGSLLVERLRLGPQRAYQLLHQAVLDLWRGGTRERKRQQALQTQRRPPQRREKKKKGKGGTRERERERVGEGGVRALNADAEASAVVGASLGLGSSRV